MARHKSSGCSSRIQVVDTDTRRGQYGSIIAGKMVESGFGNAIKRNFSADLLGANATNINNVAFGFFEVRNGEFSEMDDT